jgi:hypothetical protein
MYISGERYHIYDFTVTDVHNISLKHWGFLPYRISRENILKKIRIVNSNATPLLSLAEWQVSFKKNCRNNFSFHWEQQYNTKCTVPL